MSKIKKADIAIAEEILDRLDYHYDLGIRQLFEDAGKISELANEGTTAEKDEQKKLLKDVFSGDAKRLYSSLKMKDIFTNVARRAANKVSLTQNNEAAFAALIPTQTKPPQEHIDMLKHYQFDNLAAVLEQL